jgi:hypothetical protein
VAQTAAKLVLEPIFEADLEDSAYVGIGPAAAGLMPSGKCTGNCARVTPT